MKTSVKQLSKGHVELTVEVDSAFWKEAQEKAFRKLASKISLPGFRPGKAPEAMLRARVSQTQIWNEALESVLDPVYGEAVMAEKLSPFQRPEVNVTKLTADELTLSFKILLFPEVKLGKYVGLGAKKEAAAVSEDEVKEALNKRLESLAEFAVVDREAAKGDCVVMDFEGFVDEKPFEGGEAKDYELVLGSNTFIPGFEDQLLGVKAGDTKEVNVTFPTQYVKELAGKPARFVCQIHDVKEKKVPELNEETIKDMKLPEVTNEEQLKEFEKKSLLESKVRTINDDYYEALLVRICEQAEAVIADEILAREAAEQEKKTKDQIEKQGLTFQQYLEITGQSEDALRAQLRSQAETSIKRFLVLDEIARQEKLTVSQEELDAELQKLADSYKMKLEDVKNALQNNLGSFRESIQNRKVRAFLEEKNPPVSE